MKSEIMTIVTANNSPNTRLAQKVPSMVKKALEEYFPTVYE
jgi:hypothetical protein